MSDDSYEQVYGLLNEEAEKDLRTLEELIDDAVEEERSMTSSSLPEGFSDEILEEQDDFGFQGSKEYDDGTIIEIQYGERTHSFRPESSSVQINVKPPYTFTDHWNQKR